MCEHVYMHVDSPMCSLDIFPCETNSQRPVIMFPPYPAIVHCRLYVSAVAVIRKQSCLWLASPSEMSQSSSTFQFVELTSKSLHLQTAIFAVSLQGSNGSLVMFSVAGREQNPEILHSKLNLFNNGDYELHCRSSKSLYCLKRLGVEAGQFRGEFPARSPFRAYI
jgi:hypothetical protein